MLRKISNFMCRCNILSCLLAGTYWATDYRLSRDRFLILLFENITTERVGKIWIEVSNKEYFYFYYYTHYVDVHNHY